MERLNREFTSREKLLLVILALLLIFVCYFKFILTPINEGIDEYHDMTAQQEDEFLVNFQKAGIVKNMEAELAEIKSSGTVRPLPAYDNSSVLLVQLRTILDSSLVEYNMEFSKLKNYDEYLICRPLQLSFTADSYETVRHIIDQISDEPTVQQITNLDIRNRWVSRRVTNGDTEYSFEVYVSMTVNYYEYKQK